MVASLFQKGSSFLSRQQTSIMSAAVLIGVLSLFSALLGAVKYRTLEEQFVGDGGKLLIDSFFAAFRVPDFLFQLLVVGVLSATFIPVYSRIADDKEQTKRLVSTLLTVLALAYLVVALVAAVFARQIITSFTGAEFLPFQIDAAVSMMRIMLLAQFFFLVSNFLSGILQSNRNFLLPALSPVLYNLGIITGTVLLSPYFGIAGPAIGVVIGALAHFVVQLPFALRLGFSYRPMLSLKDPNVKEVMRLMVPRGATLSTNSVEDFVKVYVATNIGGGLLRIVEYSSFLSAAPVRFIGVSIAQAALPFFSSQAKEKDTGGFTRLIIKTLHQIAFFMFPMGALLLVLRIPIVRLGVGAKGLPWADTVTIGRMVALYALAIGAQAMIHVVLRAFYALKETRTPFFIALFSMVVNVVVMYGGAILLGWGLYAIAFGTLMATFVELGLLLTILFKRLQNFPIKEFFLPQSKIALAALFMAGALYIPMKFLDQLVFDTTRTTGLVMLTGMASLSGLVVYLVFCKLLNVEQLSVLASMHGKLRNWQSKLSGTTEVINAPEESGDGIG